jgi:tripartite-type tricarboxylate transporter receptor subunit TctC
VAAMLAAAPLTAAEWPLRPVRIVVPLAPGGSGDMLARLIGQSLSETFAQQFIIDNRPGASGLIGGRVVAQAEPDGHTLIVSNSSTHVLAPAVQSAGYDPVADFTHIAYIGGPPLVLVAHPALGVRSFQELRSLLKSSGGLDYVSPGVGSLGHLVPIALAQKEGVRLKHIPYKGSTPAVHDLLAGHVKLGSLTWTTALAQIRAGQLIPLAVTSGRRMADAPDVPTLAELGHPDLVATLWYGLSGPPQLPSGIAARLNIETNRLLERPAVRKQLEREGVETGSMTPEAYTAFIRREIEKWAPIASGITASPN